MQVWFIFSLVFSLVVAVFAVLNSNVVTINLFWVNYELSQSIVIIASAALGATIAFFLSLLSKIKSGLKIRELSGDLKDAEKKIQLLQSSVKNFENNYEKKSPATNNDVSPDVQPLSGVSENTKS
ncbi:MAG: LapA family protein [Eubacteriales bacterium]